MCSDAVDGAAVMLKGLKVNSNACRNFSKTSQVDSPEPVSVQVQDQKYVANNFEIATWQQKWQHLSQDQINP